jgi:hypothetical protein
MITIRDKLNCVLRELRLRRRLYPRAIAHGRMTQEEAKREIEIMEAIEADYVQKLAESRPDLITMRHQAADS